MLSVAGIIAAFLAPFASGSPDGLEHTAERLGFAGRATAEWNTPFADYGLPFDTHAGLETAVAGLIGILAVAAIAYAVSRGAGAPP